MSGQLKEQNIGDLAMHCYSFEYYVSFELTAQLQKSQLIVFWRMIC